MVSYSSNRIARSIIRILDSMDFDFTIMGDDETCCGDPMFRVGDVKEGKRMIEENIRKFDKYGVKTIFSSCAGCINTFRARYPDRFRFIHITQLFDQLQKEGSLKFNKELKKKIIYFDGCDLGRHSGIFEEPRNVLKAIPGVELLEYDANRDNAFCCGGPFMAGYPDLAKRIAARRIREAKEKGAEMIATSCPTCMVNLKEGAKVAGIGMEIMDIPMLLPKLLMKDSKKIRKGNEK